MLLVISYPTAIANEARIINRLFDEGLSLFHLRKPAGTEEQLRQLVVEIDLKHHSKLVFHQHHVLARTLGIRRFHFTEAVRNNLTEEELKQLKRELTQMSTSVHSTEDYLKLSMLFDYAFLGPVFDSISKKDYKAATFTHDLKKIKTDATKLIALGGISFTNYQKALFMGFDGVAVLGSIWESKDPVNEFIKLQESCRYSEITL
jgi:thiamine-phosphate pyrophosphorylase